MSEQFDPYRKWLGIPPEEQPPHHYRLLGLVPFESDTEVIATAADGRMALLKQFQNGPFSAYSQQLLNEVAAARLCLLNPEKRAAYDAELRRTLSNGALKKPAAPAKAPALPEIKIEVEPVRRTGAVRRGKGSAASAKSADNQSGSTVGASDAAPRPFWMKPAVITVAALALVGIAAIGVWAVSGGGDRRPASRAEDAPDRSAETSAQSVPVSVKADNDRSRPNGNPKPNGGQKSGGASGSSGNSPQAVAQPAQPRTLEDLLDPTAKPTVEPKSSVATEGSEKPKDEEPSDASKPSSPSDEPTTPVAAPATSGKAPVPDSAAQQAAERQIREVFKKEFAEAKNSETRTALAETLLGQAHQTDNTPDQRFMLYRLAIGLLIEAGEYQKAFSAIDEMGSHFAITPLNVKLALLDESVKNRALDNGTAVFMAALPLVDAAIAADDFETAQKLSRTALAAAKKSRDRQAEQTIGLKEREIDRLKLRFSAVQKAMQTLTEQPDDAEANKIVGLWYCLTKRQWEKGLPYLVKSGDKRWADAAKLELAGPTEPKDVVAAADQWWQVAERETIKAQRSAVEAHAVSLYEKALPKLTGLEKTRVEKRIADAIATGDETLQAGAGVIKPGNVALATNGTTVASDKQIFAPGDMLDGVTQGYSAKKGGFTYSAFPCQWVISFDRVYRLQLIRMLLLDDIERKYRYRIELSADGVNFAPLVDYSQEDRSSWQEIKFPPRPVKAVRVIGLKHSLDPCFHVVEFEAYCVPPKN